MSRDRGQLILIGALALAISFVAIALVLNSAIYTHNLASRYDSPADDAATFDRDVRIAAGGMVEYANENHAADGYDDVVGNYTEGLRHIDDSVSHGGVVSGRIRHVRHVDGSTTEGIRVADLDPGGNTFQPADGTPNPWSVTVDTNVRQFEMVVNRSNLEQVADGDDIQSILENLLSSSTSPFTVEFDDGSTTYRAAIFNDTSTADAVGVTVYNYTSGTIVGTCTASQSNVTIDWTDARVAGEPCEPLTVVENLDDSYTTRYYYGDMVRGGYELVGDRVVDGVAEGTGPFTDAVDAANYGNHCGDSSEKRTYNASSSGMYPIVSPAIYGTNITTIYDGSDVTYKSTQRVAPGEITRPTNPRITIFSVVEPDTESNDGEYYVDWSVSDPNGDSTTTTVTATDASGDVTDIGTQGTVTLEVGDGPYTFEIVVEDGDGNSRSATQTHHDNGGESGCPI